MNIIKIIQDKWRTEKVAFALFLTFGVSAILLSQTGLATNNLVNTMPNNTLAFFLVVLMGVAGVAMFRKDL